jgi:tetratricopeptide (TPR) repeat protein
MKTKVKLPLTSTTFVAWLFGLFSLTLLSKAYPFETGKVLYSPEHSRHQNKNDDGKLVVFDNDFLDRFFGRDRAVERPQPNADTAQPKVFEGNSPISPILLPNRSLLAGINPRTSPRRAAALRIAERGRTLMQKREYQRAVSELEKALSLDASPFIYFYLARAHHQLGDNQRSLNFLAVAESRLDGQAEWIDELAALRTAAVAPQVTPQTISKRFIVDY